MKTKKVALNITQKTASNLRKSSVSPRKSHHPSLPAAHSKTRGKNSVAPEVDTVSWIVISNVDAKAAFKNIIEVLFQNCGEVRSHAFRCDPQGKFRGVIDVAFEKTEAAEDAVDLYHNNIKLFGRAWKLHLIDKRRHTRSSTVAASSCSTEPSFCPLTSIQVASRAAKFTRSTLSTAVRALRLQESAGGIGVSANVHISNISSYVSRDIVQLLLEKAGRLKSLHVKHYAARNKPGTANVVYRRSEDAVAAVRHFANNVAFFGLTWKVELESNEASQPHGMNNPSSSIW